MAAPILAGIGKVIMGAVTGTAKGLSMGAKSSGSLRMSATTVRSNIFKSNKKLRRIKLNRRRISRSIFNEQKRKKREQKLEGRRKKVSPLGILSSPLAAAGGIKKFIMTILFGLLITNLGNVKKFFDKIGQGFTDFGKSIRDTYDGLIKILTFGLIDGQKMRSDRQNADKEFDKLRYVLDSMNIDLLKKFAHKLGSGWYINPKTIKDVSENKVGTGLGAKGALGILDLHVWQAIGRVGEVNEAITNENRKKELLGANYQGPLNKLYTGPMVTKKKKWWQLPVLNAGTYFLGDQKIGNHEDYLNWLDTPIGKDYLKNIERNKLDNLMNSNGAAGSNENTVIINQPIIKKVYVPVGG